EHIESASAPNSGHHARPPSTARRAAGARNMASPRLGRAMPCWHSYAPCAGAVSGKGAKDIAMARAGIKKNPIIHGVFGWSHHSGGEGRDEGALPRTRSQRLADRPPHPDPLPASATTQMLDHFQNIPAAHAGVGHLVHQVADEMDAEPA